MQKHRLTSGLIAAIVFVTGCQPSFVFGATNMTISNDPDASFSNISWATISLGLGGGSFIISTVGSPGVEAGNITITAPTTPAINTSNYLAFNAAGSMLVNAAVTATMSSLNFSASNGGIAFNAAVNLSGNISGTAAGAITQTTGVNVSGTSSFSAGANSITLTNANNDFGGAVSLTNTGGNNVSLTDKNALALGTSSVGTGTLTLNAVGMTQTGAITQAAGAGAVTVAGNGGAVTLNHANNDFKGSVSVTNSGANDVTINDLNSLSFSTSTVGRALQVSAASGITLSGSVTSGTTQTYQNDVTLGAATNLTGTTVTLQGTTTGGGNGLTVTGNAAFGNTVSGLSSLAVTGTTSLSSAGGVTTTGSQTYGGNVTLAATTSTFSSTGAGAINFNGSAITGSGRNLTISGTGNATLTAAVQTGNGTVTMSGTGIMSMLATGNSYTGQTIVSSGKLIVDGSIASSSGVSLASSALLGGHGFVSVISGQGRVTPGNSAGILTATSLDPSAGLDFTFEFGHIGSPGYGDESASGNDVLNITGPTPFSTDLTSANEVVIDFTSVTLADGQVYKGGFYATTDFLGSINAATFTYLGLDPMWAVEVSTVEETASFSSGNVSGYVSQFTITSVPEPGRMILLLVAGVAHALRRRRC